MGKRKVVEDLTTGQTYVWYGHELAEEPCKQVPAVTGEDVFAHSKTDEVGQLNYQDDQKYMPGFTPILDFNYVCTAFCHRAFYTKMAFGLLKNCNPTKTKDWGDDYRFFVEEMFNIKADHLSWLQKKMGTNAVHKYNELLKYKMKGLADGKSNIEKQRNYQESLRANEQHDNDLGNAQEAMEVETNNAHQQNTIVPDDSGLDETGPSQNITADWHQDAAM